MAAWLGPEMDEILAGYRLGELTAFQSEGFDEPANWKLMQDAFVDNYHIQYAHPNTAGKHIHTNVQTVEDFGRHARMVSPRKAIDRWLEEDPGDRDLGRYVTEGHFLLPNSTLLRQPDDHFELLTFRPHPADPGRSPDGDAAAGPAAGGQRDDAGALGAVWDKNWEILLAVLHQEDFPLLRARRTALASADAGDMLLGRNEVVNQIFHRELSKLLEAWSTDLPWTCRWPACGCSTSLRGPRQYCGRYLADLGAQVILVEPPGGSAGGGDPVAFGLRNANKSSVLLDLADEAGQAELLRLAGERRTSCSSRPAGGRAAAG